jgi:hypothetical protein
MWRCHILTWGGVINRQRILNALDTVEDVVNWRASTGAIFIVTGLNLTSSELAFKLRPKLNGIRFIVASIVGQQAQGESDTATWNFINFPAPRA